MEKKGQEMRFLNPIFTVTGLSRPWDYLSASDSKIGKKQSIFKVLRVKVSKI